MKNTNSTLRQLLEGVTRKEFAPLDFIGKGSLTERILALSLGEKPPSGVPGRRQDWQRLTDSLRDVDVDNVRVVVLGGGTGLSLS